MPLTQGQSPRLSRSAQLTPHLGPAVFPCPHTAVTHTTPCYLLLSVVQSTCPPPGFHQQRLLPGTSLRQGMDCPGVGDLDASPLLRHLLEPQGMCLGLGLGDGGMIESNVDEETGFPQLNHALHLGFVREEQNMTRCHKPHRTALPPTLPWQASAK